MFFYTGVPQIYVVWNYANVDLKAICLLQSLPLGLLVIITIFMHF